MSLSLFKSPGAVMMLDDDATFLEMMALVLPPEWPLRLLLRPSECVAQLTRQRTVRDADRWRQQEIVERWHKIRMPLVPQILDYWRQSPVRYQLTQVAVVDYSMPAMDGFQVLAALHDWPGMRILLTGRADDQLAVDAFNQGLIQQFVPKQAADMVQRLLAAIRRLQTAAEPRVAQIWRSTLSPRQYALLNLPSVTRALEEWSERHWVEHAVIGNPFGLLGRDAEGNASWLQLEAAGDLDELVESMDAADLSAAELDDVRRGHKLVDFELRQVLGSQDPVELRPAFAIGNEEPLLGASFSLPDQPDDSGSSFGQFMAQQTARWVEQ